MHVIIGAGPVAMATVETLVGAGESVRVACRSGVAPVPEGVEVVAADVTDPVAAERACAAAEVVYHCAAPPYGDWARAFPALQAGVIAGASAACARLVAVENLYPYGVSGGRPLTEGSPIRPTSGKGRVRAALADALMAAHRSDRVRATAARPADYIGPLGVRSVYGEMMMGAACKGRTARVLGDPDVRRSVSFLPDIARTLVALGRTDSALGAAWIVPNAPAVTQRRLAEMAFAAAGTRPRVAATSRWMLRLAGLRDAGARESVELLDTFTEDHVADGARAARLLDVTPTPLEDAVAQTIDWFRSR